MASLADLIKHPSTLIQPGAVFLGHLDGVDHQKFYVIAGISEDMVLVCSVLINSSINPFILRRQHLLQLQIEITPDDYDFLDHVSYINCANPIKGQLSHFDGTDFSYKAQLNKNHLINIQNNIKDSGLLTPEEIKIFFGR
ncbi:MAG: hypothetical protein U0K66_13385 [Paludibacteraceae bacterium]|jgi:hypothetical protein|nr:hypothetical protein [Paludibacteraceae bacterium]